MAESKMPELPDDSATLRRVILMAHIGRRRGPRWSHVGFLTGNGSGFSAALCRRFGLDPDKVVGGNDAVEWDAPIPAHPPREDERAGGEEVVAWQYRSKWTTGHEWDGWKTLVKSSELAAAKRKAAERPDMYEVRGLVPAAPSRGGVVVTEAMIEGAVRAFWKGYNDGPHGGRGFNPARRAGCTAAGVRAVIEYCALGGGQ